MTTLKGNAMVPAPKAGQTKLSRPPLIGFVVSSLGSDNLPNARTKEGFDPNAYKLMKKASYDFQNPTTLGKVVEAKPDGLNETQRKIEEQGDSVGVSKLNLVSRHHNQSGSQDDRRVSNQQFSTSQQKSWMRVMTKILKQTQSLLYLIGYKHPL